jgi:hypothetical protein
MRVRATALAVAALVAAASCSSDGAATAERAQAAALRADPALGIDVAGTATGPRRVTGGHGGSHPVEGRATRTWRISADPTEVFLASLDGLRALQVQFASITCSPHLLSALGAKPVDRWRADVLLAVEREDGGDQQISLTLPAGSGPRADRPEATAVDPRCPAELVDRISGASD